MFQVANESRGQLTNLLPLYRDNTLPNNPGKSLQPQMTESPVKKKSRSPSPRGSFRLQMSPKSIRKTHRLMTSAAKAIEHKKEKFADLIVILGLKYQEFNSKPSFHLKIQNRSSKCRAASCRHVPF